MFNFIWPIVLVVLSNVMYQICTKSVPDDVNPFVSLTVTYLVGAILSFAMSFVINRQTDIVKELTKVNWSSWLLGVSVVGLEAGFIYAFKAGWQVSITSIVQSSILTVILIFVGLFAYKESLSWNKIIGIIICVIGLAIINIK